MRRAVTLVEVLVCLAIMALLIALALPAVHSIRAAAARMRCAGNLRQLGLALHSYHDVNGKFPPGRTDRQNALPFAAWPVFLLPHIEQEALWRDTQSAFLTQANPFYSPPHTAISFNVPVLLCPLDFRIQSAPELHRFDYLGGKFSALPTAMLSYLGVAGTDRMRRDGVLFGSNAVGFNSVLDGSSNTVCIGERPPSRDLYLGWWYSGIGTDGRGTADHFLGVRELSTGRGWDKGCSAIPYHFAPGRFDDPCDHLHFWSPHSGGAHFVFVDGSVRLLRYDADILLPALATRAGGEVTNLVD